MKSSFVFKPQDAKLNNSYSAVEMASVVNAAAVACGTHIP